MGDEQSAQQSRPTHELTDLPPEIWERVLRSLYSLRQTSSCKRLCKALTPGARSVVLSSVHKLKEELLLTLQPAHSVEPEATPIEQMTTEQLLSAGGNILSTALWFGGIGHICGYPRVGFAKGQTDWNKAFTCSPETRVLHAGATLRVHFSQHVAAVLGDAHKSCDAIVLAPPTSGFWSCRDIVTARERVLRPILEQHTALFEQMARAVGQWDDESPPADRVEPRLRLRRFGLDEVELTMDANAYNMEHFWDNF